MRERAVEFGGEQKLRIDGSHLPAPELGHLGFERAVKGRVDFRGVEKSGQVFHRMGFVSPHPRGIKNAFPIFVGPSGRAEANFLRTSVRRPDWGRGFHGPWTRTQTVGSGKIS